MKKILSLTMAFLLSASVCLFSSCQYIDGLLDAFPSFPSDKTECTAHSFGEWETVKEASCIAGEKQRVCESCDFTETEGLPALNNFFAHTFDENTLCTSCGHQEFIESEEYITIDNQSTDRFTHIVYTWWSTDRSYALEICTSNYGTSSICTYISSYLGSPINIVIPSSINEVPITAIGGYYGFGGVKTPFANCTTLENLILPEGLIAIREDSFRECTNLKQLTSFNSALSITYNAFYNCTSLTEFTYPKDTTYVNLNAFLGCTSLTAIYAPKTVDITIKYDYHPSSVYVPGLDDIVFYD